MPRSIALSFNDPDCQLTYYLTFVSCHYCLVLITFDILMIIVDTVSYINRESSSLGYLSNQHSSSQSFEESNQVPLFQCLYFQAQP